MSKVMRQPRVLDWLDLRLRVEGASPTSEVNVGLTRAADIQRYLLGATYREVVELDGQTRRTARWPPAAEPSRRCITDVSIRGAPGCVGLCGYVPDRAPITPARPLRCDTLRHRTTHPDIPIFRIWEQEAESSNLSIPTSECKGFRFLAKAETVRAGGFPGYILVLRQTSRRMLHGWLGDIGRSPDSTSDHVVFDTPASIATARIDHPRLRRSCRIGLRSSPVMVRV